MFLELPVLAMMMVKAIQKREVEMEGLGSHFWAYCVLCVLTMMTVISVQLTGWVE